MNRLFFFFKANAGADYSVNQLIMTRQAVKHLLDDPLVPPADCARIASEANRASPSSSSKTFRLSQSPPASWSE